MTQLAALYGRRAARKRRGRNIHTLSGRGGIPEVTKGQYGRESGQCTPVRGVSATVCGMRESRAMRPPFVSRSRNAMRVTLSPFAHELHYTGDRCAEDCPACRWVEEQRAKNRSEKLPRNCRNPARGWLLRFRKSQARCCRVNGLEVLPLWRLAYPLRNRLRLEFPFRRNHRRQPLTDSVSAPFTLSRLGCEISVSFRSVLQACLVWNVSRRSLSNFIPQLFIYGAGALSEGSPGPCPPSVIATLSIDRTPFLRSPGDTQPIVCLCP